jgi:hypothetical protein
VTKTSTILVLVAALVVCLVASAPAPIKAAIPAIAARTALLDAAPRRLSAASWWGGTYVVADGQRLDLNISTRYPQSEAFAQEWVAFFAGLPHGNELSLVKVYVAPLDEVGEMCFSTDVIGCYGGQTLVTIGEAIDGIAATSVAAHEYGHHIAANRDNAPWRAIDWGTKRWASRMQVCSRVDAGTAFPGDEDANYALNPGEGFAEAYRVLAETNGTAFGYDWPIIDPSFRPDTQALVALREDVLRPWAGPTTTTISGKFLRRSRTWSTRVSTPLDGNLRVRVTAPDGEANDVTLLSSDGRTVVATGSWDSSGGKSVQYRVCGARSVKVRVTRGGAAARFTLRVTVP